MKKSKIEKRVKKYYNKHTNNIQNILNVNSEDILEITIDKIKTALEVIN